VRFNLRDFFFLIITRKLSASSCYSPRKNRSQSIKKSLKKKLIFDKRDTVYIHLRTYRIVHRHPTVHRSLFGSWPSFKNRSPAGPEAGDSGPFVLQRHFAFHVKRIRVYTIHTARRNVSHLRYTYIAPIFIFVGPNSRSV